MCFISFFVSLIPRASPAEVFHDEDGMKQCRKWKIIRQTELQADYWIFEQQLCLDRRKNKGAKVIWCNSMERDIFTACINFSRPKLPPALKDSTAHLATAEIRLAFGLDCVWILCAGHLLWNTLSWCDHQLKMSSSVRVRKPRLLPTFCLCNSVISGVSVCMSFSMLQWRSLSIRAFLKVIWQS